MRHLIARASRRIMRF